MNMHVCHLPRTIFDTLRDHAPASCPNSCIHRVLRLEGPDLRLLAADKGRDKVGKVLFQSAPVICSRFCLPLDCASGDRIHHPCVRPAKRSMTQLRRNRNTHLALVLGNGQLGLGRHARAVRARDGGRAPRSTARDLVNIAEKLVGVAEGDKDDCTFSPSVYFCASSSASLDRLHPPLASVLYVCVKGKKTHDPCAQRKAQ